MESWLIVIILSYFCFALSALGDKLFLQGRTTPAFYVFYATAFGLFSFLLFPFADFTYFSYKALMWAGLSGLMRFFAIYFGYKAIEKFEVSRIIPSIGALQPVIVFLLAWIFLGSVVRDPKYLSAFIVLLVGSFAISFEKKIEFNINYLFSAFTAALFASLDFLFSKNVYSTMTGKFSDSLILSSAGFFAGFLLISFFSFFFALFLFFSKKARFDIFSSQIFSDNKNKTYFLGAQLSGGLGGLLYHFGISLTPVAFLAIASSLRGVQYVFLFLITIFVSVFYSRVLKEELTKKIVIQKIIALLIIVMGLVIFAL